MATNKVRSPGSRLGDDLYRLYLLALAWLVFPVYGEAFAFVLPTSQATLRWVFPVVAILVQLGWFWSGVRGGPMTVTRASIVHELSAPIPARRVLAPQLLRQAIAWGAGGAMLGGVLTSIGDSFSFSEAAPVSAASFLLLFSAVMWASVVMVGLRSHKSLRIACMAAALTAAAAVSVPVIAAVSITSGDVVVVLGLSAIAGSATASWAINRVPVHSVWQRARNLESARSAMLEVDFHRMMIDLRGAGDNKAVGVTRLPTKRLPSMWRSLAPIRHALPWSGIRLSAGSLAAVLLLVFAPITQGVVLLAIGAVWLVLGYEITRGISAVADQVSFLTHYPHNSLRLLGGQLLASLTLGTLLLASSYGWWFVVDQTEATVATLVASMGIIGGAIQARLGSPDTTAFVENYGLETAAALLWIRATAAPIAVIVMTILVVHGFSLQPVDLGFDIDTSLIAQPLIPILFAVGLLISLAPLEKAAR